MTYPVTVKLREKEYEIEVERDHGYEEDTGAHDIDWHWVDEAPPDMTDKEDQLVSDQIYEASRNHAEDADNYDERE